MDTCCNGGLRFETMLETGGARAWHISARALEDQGLLETEMRDLNDYLRTIDTGLDGNGSFVRQTEEALLQVLDTGKRRSLVVAYSEHAEMTIDIIPVTTSTH